jgi:hypothetical protein
MRQGPTRRSTLFVTDSLIVIFSKHLEDLRNEPCVNQHGLSGRVNEQNRNMGTDGSISGLMGQ